MHFLPVHSWHDHHYRSTLTGRVATAGDLREAGVYGFRGRSSVLREDIAAACVRDGTAIPLPYPPE